MNIKNKLYGDGIHDDYPAIQEMLDSGMSCVYLPVPAKYYSISKTLLLSMESMGRKVTVP